MSLGASPVKPFPSGDIYHEDKQTHAPELGSLPEDALAHIFAYLPQSDRAKVALCCKRWSLISRSSRSMWRSVCLDLCLDRPNCVDRSEAFIAWLMNRPGSVKVLMVTGRMEPHPGSLNQGPLQQQEQLIWGNITTALTLLGGTLDELVMEWQRDLHISSWMSALINLQTVSFTAAHITVRFGLGGLTSLQNLRFKSLHSPLHIHPGAVNGSNSSEPGLGNGERRCKSLPPNLVALRMDGCHLSTLPQEVTNLRHLTDLVLSNNNLDERSLQGLSKLSSLKQLTLMGTRMGNLPSVLSTLTSLRVLYLDGVISQVADGQNGAPYGSVLEPLHNLGILSLGSSKLKAFPGVLEEMSSLRALYLDNNPLLSHIPNGLYLRNLRVLGIDWNVLFKSHNVLTYARQLQKLCLTGIGLVEFGPDRELESASVAASLLSHPSLSLILLPMVENSNVQLSRVVLDLALQLAANQRLLVRAVTYGGISNEWIEWLEEVEKENEERLDLENNFKLLRVENY